MDIALGHTERSGHTSPLSDSGGAPRFGL